MTIVARASGTARVGDAVQHQRDQRERRAEHVDRVLEIHGHDRRVRALAEQLPDRHATLGCLAAELPQRDGTADRVECERDHEHRDADPERVQRRRVDQRVDALPDRQRAADDEHPDRCQQRPVVPLGTVAERVRRIGRTARAAQRDPQQHLVAGIGDRVQRLGQQRGRARQHRRYALRQGDRRVRRERRQDAGQALVAPVRTPRRRDSCRHGSTAAPALGLDHDLQAVASRRDLERLAHGLQREPVRDERLARRPPRPRPAAARADRPPSCAGRARASGPCDVRPRPRSSSGRPPGSPRARLALPAAPRAAPRRRRRRCPRPRTTRRPPGRPTTRSRPVRSRPPPRRRARRPGGARAARRRA